MCPLKSVPSVQGTDHFHPRIVDLSKTCHSISILCKIHGPRNATLGHYPHLVDVEVENIEIPEYRLIVDIYRCHYWKTGERFSFVAIGTGYLLSKLSLRGIPLHDKF